MCSCRMVGAASFSRTHTALASRCTSSQVVSAALTSPGVAWVEVKRFGRWHDRSNAALDSGFVAIGPLEIARVDNDPNAPQNGQISFEMVPA